MDSSKILSTRGLNTLMFSDPFAKLCFAAHLASHYDRVLYVDLDTTFSAYLKAGLIVANEVDIYLPSEGRLVSMVKDVLASIKPGSLVIFDSVNSFYNMFKIPERGTGGLNHMLSVLLMLIVRRGVDAGAPVLATSMLRYRKDGGWVQSPASRRLLQKKSAVRMNVELHGSDIELRVIQPTEAAFVYKDAAITV